MAYGLLKKSLFLFMLSEVFHHNVDGCNECAKTVELVSGCPQTQEAWEKDAARKNCGSIPNSCTSFVYHCVMNTWNNESIKVCAPTRLIVGKKCAEYNFLGLRVQRNTKVNCNSCPPVYNSNENFKYPECYKAVRPVEPLPEVTTSVLFTSYNDISTQRNITSTYSALYGKTITSTQKMDDEPKNIISFAVVYGGLLLILLVMVLVIYKTGWGKKKFNKRKKSLDLEIEEQRKTLTLD